MATHAYILRQQDKLSAAFEATECLLTSVAVERSLNRRADSGPGHVHEPNRDVWTSLLQEALTLRKSLDQLCETLTPEVGVML